MESDSAVDSLKKVSLEDLSKEEIIKKYRGLLNILQKAKLSKDSLTEENNNLKQKLQIQANVVHTNTATEELLENLTQQKLNLVTNLEDLKNQKEALHDKLKDCELNLSRAEEKINHLDNEHQSYQRQIARLTEDNDHLLNQLVTLEKQIEELKSIGLNQQQQLLELEKNNLSQDVVEKINKMEVLKLECENLGKNNAELGVINNELMEHNKTLTNQYAEVSANIETLKINYKNAEKLIFDLKAVIEEKNKQNESYINTADDLNIELHKNKALVEKLQQDIVTMSNKLSNNQIVSSGVASDLQNVNEKLKDKLKLYHSKIVRFAGDVKLLKQNKIEILENFKNYVQQVKLWEVQLIEFSNKIITQFNEIEQEKLKLKSENENYKLKIALLKNENTALKTSNSKLTDSHEELMSKLESGHVDNKQLTEEINDLLKKNYELKNEVKFLYSECNLQKKQSTDYTNKLRMLKEEKEIEKKNLETKLEDICTQNETLNSSIQEKCKVIVDLESKLKEFMQIHQDSETIDNLNKTITNLLIEIQVLKSTENKLTEEAENNITKLVQENKNLVTINSSLEQKLSEGLMKVQTSDCKSQTDITEDHIIALKRENSELLMEMNEMNQVLKERGETISKQQEYCEELLKNVKICEAQNGRNLEIIHQKEEITSKLEHDLDLLKSQPVSHSTISFNQMHETLIKKDEEITQLRNELSVMHEKLNVSHTIDSSQDVSYAESETMSTSTISRTEEMNRIKDLEGSWEERYGKLRCLALKLKGKIRDLTNELTKEQNEKVEIHQKFSNSLKTIQTLQNQYDKLQDEVEQRKKEMKEYLKRLDSAALDISSNKKQLANNDEIISKLKSEIDALNKEKTGMENWKKQVSSKVQNLKKELEANNVMKKDFEDQIVKLNTQLEVKEKSLQEEIENHIFTRNSLQESHNECKKQSVLNLEMQDYERSLKDLTQKLEKKQELINKLKNQIDGQKSTVSTVKEQNRLLEGRIQNNETDIISARSEIQAYKKTITDLETVILQKDDKIQNVTRTLEECRSENEELTTQLSKIVSENQKLYNSLKIEKEYLQSQNSGLEQKLREIEDSLKLKEEELRETQKEYQGYKVRAQSVLRQNQTRDIGLEEKLSEEAASFKAQVDVLTLELNQLKGSIEKLKDENLQLKIEKEQVEMKYRILENLVEEQRNQLEALSAKYQKAVSEHAKAIRDLKIHAETLAQCYRQQLSEQEVRHNREIIELQSKMEKVIPVPEVSVLVSPTQPREQGEGSENTESVNHMQPVPLDQLLSNESDQDIGFARKQLLENEAKVTHLTALLADTEQDLAKHVQMNKLLKEEIRRQQRSIEREKHAENLEYLKNVVFKFATLSSGDERSRLVPVLNTILKFSPEETNKLNIVARGDLGNRGWSNYLSAWSSPSKPQ